MTNQTLHLHEKSFLHKSENRMAAFYVALGLNCTRRNKICFLNIHKPIFKLDLLCNSLNIMMPTSGLHQNLSECIDTDHLMSTREAGSVKAKNIRVTVDCRTHPRKGGEKEKSDRQNLLKGIIQADWPRPTGINCNSLLRMWACGFGKEHSSMKSVNYCIFLFINQILFLNVYLWLIRHTGDCESLLKCKF